MTYSKDNLRQIFQQPFNQHDWQMMLFNYFHATELKAEPERIDGTADDEQGYYLGAIDTTDSYRIGLFYYQIQHGNVARKRVGLRNLVKSFINPNWGEFDAALVVFDSGSGWRLSFVCDIKGENTAAKRYTYVFGETDNYYNTPVGRFDALQRNGISFENIKDAFSVERLNKDFFNGYKERYVKFLKFLNNDTKDNRDYVKKLLGRLVFLQFLQKKGWMGVPANNQGWTGGDKLYLNNLIESYEGNDRLLSDVLEPLFFNTLNERRDNDLADSRLGENIKIPYLNGGLFDKDDIDKKDIDFPYDYFKELMDFFAMYNFTIDENDPEDSEIGIDPEMLGHIFENLLEDNKDKGAFYTPKEIVQYMSKESVSQYLKSYTPEELHTAIESLIKQRVVDPILQKKENARLVNSALTKVKVCDPAIGSGAFPMGVLNVLFDCRHLLYGFIGVNEVFSYAKVKRDIIQNNIYGVDIEKGAVDIARLRFWLALVVDENEPQPLPNLDYKIMCGDSLLHRFSLDAPFKNVLRDYNQKNGTQYTLDDYRQWVYDYTDISDHTQKDIFRQKIEDIKRAVKTELSDKEKGKIAKVRGTIANLQMEDMFGGKKKENEKKIKALQKELKSLEQQREEIESNKIYEQAFEWRFEFPALLDEEGNFTGFDIVIANPPYIQLQAEKGRLSLLYSNSGYKTFFRTGDIYCLFFELGNILLKSNGILSFIVPNTWLQSITFDSFRFYLSSFFSWEKFLITEKTFDAVVDTHCVLFKKSFIQTNCEVFKQTGSSISYLHTIDKQIITQTFNCINIEASQEASSLARRIIEENSPFSSFYTIYNGVKPFEKGKGTPPQTEETMREKPFVKKGSKPNKEWLPLLRGSLMNRYVNLWENNYWILYGKWLAAPRQPEIFEATEKIIVRQTGDSIIATIIGKDIICRDNLHICVPNTNVNTKYVLGILNSKLMNFIYGYINPERGEALAQVKKNHVEQLPIALSDNKQLIGDAVTNILKTKEADCLADTRALENKIDLLVYHLYGLTYDEVRIVDPETPITREEYDKANRNIKGNN